MKLEIRNEVDKITILMYDDIDKDYGFDASVAANIVRSAPENIPIEVRINSGGGSVIEGYSLVKALLDRKYTTAYIDGVAASMAGVIAISCEKVFMVDYGLFMIHNPSMPIKNDKDYEILDKFRSSLLKIFTGRTGLELDVISRLMEAETWMDANEALSFGLVDSVVETTREEVVNKIYTIMNSIKKINDNIMKKDTLKVEDIISETKVDDLTAEAEVKEVETEMEETENEVEETEMEETEKIENEVEETENEMEEVENEMEKEMENLKSLIAELTEKNEKLEAKLKAIEEEEVENSIKAIVDEVKDKLSDAEYTKWVQIGKTDLEFVKNSVSKMKTKTSNKVNNLMNLEDVSTMESYKELSKKNPAKLKDIKNNNFELFKAMFKKDMGFDFE
jgi:ATP-dependent protease ClpP protease subunit